MSDFLSGGTYPTSIKLGNTNVTKLMVGTVQVWPRVTGLLKIGDAHQGGIIGYLLLDGDTGYDPLVQHGLIVPVADQSSGIMWHNGSLVTPANGIDIGTGAANTAAIIATYGAESNAASLCNNLVEGGYSDWYLPSIRELSSFIENTDSRDKIGGFVVGVRYWSSTDFNADFAQTVPYLVGAAKTNLYRVRAARTF